MKTTPSRRKLRFRFSPFLGGDFIRLFHRLLGHSPSGLGGFLVLFSLLFLPACTWRYSRQMVAVGPALGERAVARSTGLELFFVEILEPRTVSALIDELKEKNSCAALHNIEIDYRNRVFVLVNLPVVTVSGDCELAPPPPPVPAAPPEAPAPSAPPTPPPPVQSVPPSNAPSPSAPQAEPAPALPEASPQPPGSPASPTPEQQAPQQESPPSSLPSPPPAEQGK